MENIEALKRALSRKARELDERYRLREKLADAVDAVTSTAHKGADLLADGLEAARQRIENSEVSARVREDVERTVEQIREGAESAAQTAREKVGNFARRIEAEYRRAETVARAFDHATRAEERLRSGWERVRAWIAQNPGKTAALTFSFVAGVRAGSAFPNLGAALLGVGGANHWFFHSALAPYGLRRLTEMYMAYLRKQERLLAEGRLTEAERARLEFQEAITRYVGAPLLGVFSITLGGTLIAESFSPTRLAGAPIELILGGNPVLNSLWLFSNGLICLHNGVRFFLIAFAEAEDVERIVREIRGMLPASEGRA
ncbi:MAG: hypothetical protein N0A16_11225 [Blastocatellia bacterium]|nr:hypothetical protein [Blastocatellia bacterium]MCS7158287.1 hypothetical protein [Blastocatellia bacterium]MCX7753125.1 hypothetical protein [Blastocatellia bacterium]MDW8169439.1 hypothetical protein [Acidobacteriota bacterium]MDW8255714.1 hypothetical protein [Acidobacteriota bacterium]